MRQNRLVAFLQTAVLSAVGLLTCFIFLHATATSYAQGTPTPITAVFTSTITSTIAPTISSGIASSIAPSPTITTAINLSFNQLGGKTIDLIQPAAESFSFSLPYRWQINETESYIDLFFDVYRANVETNTLASETNSLNDVTFAILIDNQPIAIFIPQTGLNQHLQLPIPRALFADPEQTDHEISFQLQSENCVNAMQTRMTVQGDSRIHLDYDIRPLEISLAAFPHPLTQDSLSPESILLLIPAAYTDADLAAAASVAAALGQTVAGEVTLSLTTTTAVTPEQLAKQSIIAIGTPDENSFIADLYAQNLLPTTRDATGSLLDTNGNPIPVHIGVLQETPSEANPDYAYLIVTGRNEEAVARAARALSIRGADFGQRGNLALVDGIQENGGDKTQPIPDRFVLSDLGLSSSAWTGLGRHRRSLYFIIPAQWQMQEDAAITFSYLASAALDTTQSSLRVELNGQVIGEVPLMAAQAGETTITIPLPIADFQPGDLNRITFVADLAVDQPCPPPNTPQAWLRVRNDGVLLLAHDEIAPTMMETAVIPPFRPVPNLSDLLFAMPAAPTAIEMNSLVQLAQMLGESSVGGGFHPLVQRPPFTDTETFAPYQVVAIGRPSTNPLITAVNADLPQPFLPNGDNLGETVGNLQYRLPDDFSLGIIQYLSAPWNEERPFVLISGTTEEGIRWATDALTSPPLNGELTGRTIFIQDTFVESLDLSTIRPFFELTTYPEISPDKLDSVTVTPTPTPTATATIVMTETVPVETAVFTLIDRYTPPDTTSSTINTAIIALISSGLLLMIGGALYTWYRSRKNSKTT